MIADLGRWLLWTRGRRMAQGISPSQLRGLARLAGRWQDRLQPARRALLHREISRSFAGPWSASRLSELGRASSEVWVQGLAEELLLNRLTPASVDAWMGFEGREHLDAALAEGRGAVLLFPHAGSIMLLIARLSLSGYDYSQVAARGFLPGSVPSELQRRTRAAREHAEDALPAHFVPITHSPRVLLRALARGGVVGIAMDGRAGRGFARSSWLGRPALLSTGPYRLAALARAPIVPAFCRRDPDGRNQLVLYSALAPGPWQALLPRCRALIEPQLCAHPDHYARWLLHAVEHAHFDDHPLFLDYAATG